MNQKEYELIAKTLRDQDFKWRSITSGAAAGKVRARLIRVFADALEEEYKNFDRLKFYVAAGMSVGDVLDQ